MTNEWTDAGHALAYLGRADDVPHRAEGEQVVLEVIPADARRVLDLGTGDGRLLGLVRAARPGVVAVGVDFSSTMLAAAASRFEGAADVALRHWDLEDPLVGADLGEFDAVVSSFAIHHLADVRKRALYEEVFEVLVPGGVFCNLEHVASPSPRLHAEFLAALGETPETEDPSNKLSEVETQLGWLRAIGFEDVDCLWKWRELALLVASKPDGREPVGA